MGHHSASAAAATAGGRLSTKQVLAWASWDWGSSVISSVMTTFVFAVYVTSPLFGNPTENSAVLSAAMALSGLAIALMAPVTGQRADAGGRRKFWLLANTLLVILATAACFFVYPGPGYLLLGVALLAVANVFGEFANVNYYAMLPQIATPATVGRVSGFGWGMGYVGSILALAIVLFGFVQPLVEWPGSSSDGSLNLRLVAVFSAVWFLVFALPLFFAVPELPRRPDAPRVGIAGSYRLLWRHIVSLAMTSPHTLFFLAASAVFRDGLAAVFTFGGVIAAVTFGFTTQQVIVFAIAGNLVAAAGALVGGFLDDRIGPKAVIVGSLSGLVVAAMGVFLSPGAAGFWIFGLFLCLFVGPAQASSRAYLARLAPEGREGELFGLYATTGRAVSFLAPALFTVAITLAIPFAGDGAQRYGILGIVVVLLAGLLLLLPVRKPQSA